MGKKKGDIVEISGFNGIVINDIPVKPEVDNDGTPSVRVSYTLKNGYKFWIVVPNELIKKRGPR